MKETPVAYAGFEDSPGSRLHITPSYPDLVLRRPLPKDYLDDEIFLEGDEKFAHLLMELDEKYDIKTPGMSMIEAREFTSGKNKVFIATQRIRGKNLFHNSSEIPVEVIEKAVEAIIRYYQDAKNNGGDYITDLTPENIVYGRLKSDTHDQLYFIDLDPYFWSKLDSESQSLDDNVQSRVFSELRLLTSQRLNGRDSYQRLMDDLQRLPSYP